MSKHKPRKDARRPHTSSTAAQHGQAKRIASTAERDKLTALHRQGQFIEAMTLARSILETSPDDAFVWTALGSSLIKQQEYQEALQALEQANSLFPDDHLILDSLAWVHTRLGDHPQALTLQRRSLELEPGHAAGHFHLASLLNECGDAQALEHLEQAEALGHDLTEVLALRGAVQTALFRFNDALASFRKLVEISPDNPEVQNNIANVYKDIGDFAAAEAAYYKALELNPTYAKAYSNLLFTMHYDPERTPESILALAKEWENRFAPSAQLKPIQHSRLLPGKRLRVGLLSGGLRQHPVGQMITVALEHLDDTLELHAYSTTQVQDHITARIRKTVASWQYVGHLGTQQLAERIREDGIDILIDLSGHGAGNRLSSIAMRPAPLAVKWVGCLVGSTGLSAFDYLLSDHIETPAGVEHLYVEKLIRMPDDYICYLPSENMPPITMLPASINGYVTLGCFNNPAKINPTLLAEWATLMHQLPDCRLLLKGAQYDSPEFCERIRDIMRQHGIADERLILEGPANHRALLETYNRVDIALDPWPYSGGLTTCEAMLMGVPVVTLPGPTFAGRHSATHLVNAGLPELVVDSWDEYRQRVIELANDLPNLSVIRACLRRVLMESPVCDGARFAHHFTTAMRAIWQRHCQGRAPAALSLEKDGTARFEDDEQPVKLLPLTEPTNEITTAPEFSWHIEGQIITLDNGAVLARDPAFPALQKLGSFATITFDPSSSLKNAEQLQLNGELHHYPHVTLGNGEESTLYACLDPAMTGTLEPLPAEQQLTNNQEGTQVLAKLPITTLRLDDIEGLESIDWLLLDNLNDSLTILENGEKALANTLLVQVRVNFAPTHKNQPELTQISHWLSRHGFSFYRLNDLQHQSHLPKHDDLLKKQATQLTVADVLFIPNKARLATLSDNHKLKLAFILHTAYGVQDLAVALLARIDDALAQGYLIAEKFLAAPQHEIPQEQETQVTPAPVANQNILLPQAPHMSETERALFKKALTGAKSYFEFGSGGSTVWAVREGMVVKGVESDANWVNALKQELGENCQIEAVDIGPTREWGYPVSTANSLKFANYSHAIKDHDTPFDLILVDGRFRVACTATAIQHILDHHRSPEDARIFIHDFWNRPTYHIVLEFLDTLERADTAGLFKLKPGITHEDLKQLLDKYVMQPA